MKYKIKIEDRRDNYSTQMNFRHITIFYKPYWFSKYKTAVSVVVNNNKRMLLRCEKKFKTKQELFEFLEDIWYG